MLVDPKNLIFAAKVGKYAIGSFNTSDLEITKAIIRAAEAQKSPVIIGTSEKAIEYAGLESLASIIKAEAEKTSVPVVLHLDHGQTLNVIESCLNIGYTSVMYDGSGSEFMHNEILTRQAADLAHQHRISCEGELGHLGKAGVSQSMLTDPEEVTPFIQATGVDFLAVSIGSSHGHGENEKLDIELLKKIASKTGVPLVLHGASGVPDEDIKMAISARIAKINIDTDIRHTFIASIETIVKEGKKIEDPRDMMSQVMNEIQRIVEEKIKLFGSSNKV